MGNLFYFIGKLFLAKTGEATNELLTSEADKVHEEIVLALTPLLANVPLEERKSLLEGVAGVVKQAAVAYAEAYIDAYVPKVPVQPAQNPQ